ncbi:MAG: TetR/AcrR family transcriptional regulator [Desulfovibrio sp.]|nr:MAG: TetR/AcrR family transcriptional regulator [Desulfovibrio sp.]
MIGKKPSLKGLAEGIREGIEQGIRSGLDSAKPEKMQEKRRRILDGVRKVIAGKGSLGVTMKSVAAEAGVSPGLIHYYFSDKEEMLYAVMRDNAQTLMQAFRQAFYNLKPGDDAPAIIAREYRRMHMDSPGYFNVFAECWPLAWTSRVMNAAFIQLFKDFWEAVEAMIAHLQEKGVVKPLLPLKQTAAMINSQCDGLELQLRVFPELVHDDEFWKAYEFTLRALFEE